MAKYALTVYPETDGELCAHECQFLVNGHGDDGGAAFDGHIEFAHTDGEHGDRFKRRPECLESERRAQEAGKR